MKKIPQVFKLIILLFCIGTLISSWFSWSKYHDMKQFSEKIPLNWNKNLITSITIVKNDEDCLDQQQPYIQTQLFDTKSFNLYQQIYQNDPMEIFSDQVAQIHDKDTKTQDQVAQIHDQVVQIQYNRNNKLLNSFAFIDKSQNKLQNWKMCAKSMTNISFASKKNQLLGLCEPNEKICPAENNMIVCVSNQFPCPSNTNNFCPSDKTQCEVNTKIECINYTDKCPKEDKNKQCHPTQKICIIQDRVLCQSANEKCPIVDLLIIEKSSQTPEGYEEELIRFDSNYKLLVKRNDPSKWPVAEIVIQTENNQCLTEINQIYNLFTIKNETCQLNKCVDGIDNRYEEIFQESLSTKQLLLSNNIIKEDGQVNTEFNQSFKIYQRKYFSYNTTCSNSDKFENFNTKYPGITLSNEPIFQLIIVLLSLINIIMNKIINHVQNIFKRSIIFLIESSYLYANLISVCNIILLLILNIRQTNTLDTFTSQIIENECADQYLKVNILDIQKQLIILKHLRRVQLILSIIVTFILLINLSFEMQLSNKIRKENKIVQLHIKQILFIFSCCICQISLILVRFGFCCCVKQSKQYNYNSNIRIQNSGNNKILEQCFEECVEQFVDNCAEKCTEKCCGKDCECNGWICKCDCCDNENGQCLQGVFNCDGGCDAGCECSC